MRRHGFRWMAYGMTLALCSGMLIAQTGRGSSSRGGFGSLDQGAAAGERGSSVTGPTLGYVVDSSTGNLYMVNGIAGSSTMSAPIRHGSSIRAFAIASSASYAVVSDDAGALWFYGEPTPRGTSGAALAGVTDVTHLAVSPSGDAIAAFSSVNNTVTVITVANGVPKVEKSYSVNAIASVTRIVIADGMKDPLLITSDASGSTLLRASASGVQSLAVLPNVTEAAFLSGSERMLLLDAAQSAVYETDTSASNPALTLVASSAQGIDSAVGLAVSGDNRTLAVASGANRSVTLIDLASRTATQLELPEAPTGIRRMNSRGVFQLTDASSGPILLLDAQENAARAVYVPAYAGGRGAASGRSRLE
ncbi:MAG: WD40 repeat domain-containing protein [Bryobacterales bacterium]|nr:WD40 repeat domain-containing protein [Bryobacterales bacterium]